MIDELSLLPSRFVGVDSEDSEPGFEIRKQVKEADQRALSSRLILDHKEGMKLEDQHLL